MRMLLGLILAPAAWAQFQESVTVVASRLPAIPLRRVLVLESSQLQNLPLRDCADVLRLMAGTGLARRGVFGIQADASMAGAPFEGVLVLVNGVPVNDPQTGHFHLDVPLPVEAIDRVEILAGTASPVFGSAAVGGVVAITTKTRATAQLRFGLGDHSLSSGAAQLSLGAHWSLFAKRAESRGFRADSDFHLGRLALTGSQSFGSWQLTTSLAVGGSQFGAWTFYSSRFPHQRERTGVGLFTLQAQRPLSPAHQVTVTVGARQHRDVYLLDKTRPYWYRNRHRTRQFSLSASLQGESRGLTWVVGVDGERQLLSSSRLGLHDRNRAGLFAEAVTSSGGWTFHIQSRQDWYPQEARFTPGLAAGYLWASGVRLAVHAAGAFRLPSFTELYYDSPASVGNPALRPEKAWTGEVDLAFPWKGGVWQVGAFRRWARDLVDWVRSDTGMFVAQNYARAETTGAHLDVNWDQSWGSWRTSVAYLKSDIAVDPSRSAYALAHPRWEASLAGTLRFARGVLTPILSYRKPQGKGGFVLTDLAWRWPLEGPVGLEVSVFNLTNRQYQEVPGVKQPGRWWTVGLLFRP